MQSLRSYDDSTLPDADTFSWKQYKWHTRADYSVILNFNGVLLASRELDQAAWIWLFNQVKYEQDEDGLLDLIDCGVPTALILLTLVGKLEIDPSIAEQFAITMAVRKEQFQVAAFISQGKEMRGARELLHTLSKQRIPLGLYSMFSQRSVLEILRAFKLKQFFSAVVTPDMPRRYTGGIALEQSLTELIERLGVQKDNCFLVEDSVPRVRVATQLGIACIGISEGNKQELIDAGAICVVDDLDPLVSIFGTRDTKKSVLKALKEASAR